MSPRVFSPSCGVSPFFGLLVLSFAGFGLFIAGCTDTPGVVDSTESECQGGLEYCDEECVDVDVDPEHCGECGVECDPRTNAVAECVDGECRWNCESGWVDENGDLDEPGGGCEAECKETNGGVSQCDGRDNNCDGTIDTGFPVGEECTIGDDDCTSTGVYECTDDHTDVVCDAEPPEEQTWYRDADGDGYGNPSESVVACSQPDGYVDNDLDCNDANSDIHPDATPRCDGLDTNCDGTIDTGFPVGEECTVGEGVCENTGEYVCADDGSDVECDAEPLPPKTWYRDADGDGYGDPNEPMEACTQPDGYVDNDLDCDDNDSDVYPGAPPKCDFKDTNCDGVVDHLLPDGSAAGTVSFASENLRSHSDEFPPTAMATGFEDRSLGFCAAVYDEQRERVGIAEINHDGTANIVVSDPLFSEGTLVDIETRGSMCTVLLYTDEGSSISSPYHLWAVRYNNEDIYGVREIHDDLYVHDDDHLNASVYGSEDGWEIAFTSFDTGSQGNSVEYVSLPEHFHGATDLLAEETIDSGYHSPRDIEVGPSGRSTDDFLISWQHTGTPLVTSAGLYAERYTGEEFVREDEWFVDGSEFVRPMLTEVDSTVILTARDEDNDEFLFEELLWSSVGDDLELDSDSSGSYVGRDSFVETRLYNTWWFIDSYANQSYRIDSDFSAEQQDHPNVGSDDNLLAASSGDHGVSVLRMTSDDPFVFEVDRFACH